jgi:hypothetical protein
MNEERTLNGGLRDADGEETRGRYAKQIDGLVRKKTVKRRCVKRGEKQSRVVDETVEEDGDAVDEAGQREGGDGADGGGGDERGHPATANGECFGGLKDETGMGRGAAR